MLFGCGSGIGSGAQVFSDAKMEKRVKLCKWNKFTVYGDTSEANDTTGLNDPIGFNGCLLAQYSSHFHTHLNAFQHAVANGYMYGIQIQWPHSPHTHTHTHTGYAGKHQWTTHCIGSELVSVADLGFPRGGGANPQGGGANLLFDQKFPKNCMKMKEFRPRGGARPWRPPPLRSANGYAFQPVLCRPVLCGKMDGNNT